MIKEITIISGKGGTGKTSLVGSLALFAENKILVDCDVDAADLHLILQGKKVTGCDFIGGKIAEIAPDECFSCNLCFDYCRFDAIVDRGFDQPCSIDKYKCEGCGVCTRFCPEDAISMIDIKSGEWYISETKYGRLVHARLGIAQANSGKLVSLLRGTARVLAEEKHNEYIIVDGSPGIGCPVISSITGSDFVLMVTEPSLSAVHDMRRLHELIGHFDIPCGICINKYDINPEIATVIEALAGKFGIPIMARIPYDPRVTKAQIEGIPYAEYVQEKDSEQFRKLWIEIQKKVTVKKETKPKTIQLG